MFWCAFLVLFLVYETNAQAQAMGPYILEVTNIKKCEFRGKHYTDRFPWYAESYKKNGKSYLRYNCTISIPVSGVRMHGVMSTFQNNTARKVLDVEGSACSHRIFKIFMQIMQLDTSSKDCRFRKGSYSGDGMDVDGLAHLLTKVLPYGSFLIHIWTSIPKGIIFCMQLLVESNSLPDR